jgi:Starch-binding associating with outer membrane
MKTKIISILTIIALSTSFVGCKKFLDVNKSPNIASGVSVDLVLPSAQVAIGSVLGTQFQINGSFWAQHWTQSPLANQYKIYDQYQVNSDNYNTPWQLLYAGALSDLKYVYTKAQTENKKQYMAISRLMSAYTFHVLTDAFGDIPFSEALKGSIADGGLVNPKYDSQESVYDGILAMIAEADGLISVTDKSRPGADDLVYGGNMNKWIEFSNTLKLKIYLRLSEVNPAKAAAGIASLSGKAFLTTPAFVNYTKKGGSQNPLYSEMIGLTSTTNIYGSKTCIDVMNSYGDPRAGVFYTPLSNGAVVGLKQGDFANSGNATNKSIGGFAVGANPNNESSATAPVIFISVSESEFLQAEAIARGWMTGNDKQHFENGIRAGINFYLPKIEEELENAANNNLGPFLDLTYYNPTNTSINDYVDSMISLEAPLAYPTALADKIESIITQKWVSMSGNQGFEAWTELRRTGFPVLTESVASFIGAGNFPQRFIYPTNEVNLNSKFPGQKKITDKVWWDAN